MNEIIKNMGDAFDSHQEFLEIKEELAKYSELTLNVPEYQEYVKIVEHRDELAAKSRACWEKVSELIGDAKICETAWDIFFREGYAELNDYLEKNLPKTAEMN